MPTTLRMRSVLTLVVLFLLVGVPVFAQVGTATLSGVISDPSGGVVPDVDVTATSIETGTVMTTKTNGAGIYSFTGLTPGRYHLAVRKPGFKEISIKEFQLYVQDKLEQNFSLEIGSVSESVTVNAADVHLNTTDASVSTVVNRTYVENMPLNGRSFQDLILLTPGVTTNSPQSPGTVGASGEFSVNGQRTESNYYTVDGVSANTGIEAGVPIGAGIAGSVASATALGTTQSLVSLDALEEFRVESSTYSAEFGRNPGGQFIFVTRSGTNQWHGTVFDYLRNDIFDANNWFNNYYGKPKPALRQNDFGGTLGGPLEIPGLYDGRDKTFFFFSYEGLRLLQPQEASVSYVPDASLRQSAPSALQPVLNAFPSPTPGIPDLGDGLAEFIGSWSNPSKIDSTSVRLDHTFNDRLKLFFRFSDTPSTESYRTGGIRANPAALFSSTYVARAYTFGATNSFASGVSNEFRLNYSSNESTFSDVIDNFGGAQAIDLGKLQGFAGGGYPAYGVSVGLSFGAYATTIYQGPVTGAQRQWNLVDTVSKSLGRHQLKFGGDYRRLAPIVRSQNPFADYLYFSQTSVKANSVDFGFGLAQAAAYPNYTNFSAFGQDDWRLTTRLSLSMGVRWEVNPAPGAASGNLPYTVRGSSLATLTLAPQGTPLWNTTWFNFAPRLGTAYILSNKAGHETVIRGGIGVFYDTAQQVGSYGYSGPGFTSYSFFGTLTGVPTSFPASSSQVMPVIANPPAAPYTNEPVYAFPAHLQLPYTLQWNVSVGQALGNSQTFTVSYVGSHGDRLIEQNQVNVQPFNPNFGSVQFFQNGLTSDYNSLQVQFQRRISSGLAALASYVYSHSIDYGSDNSALPYIRGNSDFDVRHSFSGALSYELPSHFKNDFARALLHHWGFDDRFTVRTGFPVTLYGNNVVNPSTGVTYNGGLGLVQGVPIYIEGPQYPGGRAINPAAFYIPPANQFGDAPRNFVRGFGASQMDLAVRREFSIHERLRLQFRAEAFNVFNHPNFGTINPYLGQNLFGQATGTLANGIGVLSPLYQLGGPRSMQFALKLVF